MFRTVIVRREIFRGAFRRVARENSSRCLSVECARRKHFHRTLSGSHKRILSPMQWTVQLRHYASLPPHNLVKLPALSPTMDSGSILSWAKKEGDKLSDGDLLCEIETDKATMGFETPEEGYLAKILIPAGTKGVPVGKLVCVIVENESDVAAFKDFTPDESAAASAPAPAAAAPAPAAPSPPPAAPAPSAPAPPPAATAAPSGSRVYASPMAKRLAEVQNLRLQGSGSGLYGSLKSGDLAAASASAPAASASASAPVSASTRPYVDIELTTMRSVIAKRLTASKQMIPHYQLTVTANVDKLLALREQVNARLKKDKVDVKVSVNDFIVKAVASACKRVPQVNAHWMETFIREFTNVDVCVAVATPTGLFTPIVFNADARGIIDISRDIKELAARAKEGTLRPEQFQGGTITVSNLGMFGIDNFNAIINPPQSMIIACGGSQDVVVPSDSEPGWRVSKFVTFTASADHRIIDGAVGAQFMKAFKENMEDPANIIF